MAEVMRSVPSLPIGFLQGFEPADRAGWRMRPLSAGGSVQPLRRRQRLLAAVVGLGLLCSTPAALAAENIVLVSGAFRRSIPVADMELLATKGQAQGLLADLLRFSKQNPVEVGKLLNQSIPLPLVLVSRLLNTRIGRPCWIASPTSCIRSKLPGRACRHCARPW